MFTPYTGNAQFDLQLNRFVHAEEDPTVATELKATLPRLRNEKDWFPQFSTLARAREKSGEHATASGYWGAAGFYAPVGSAEKLEAIEGFRREFYLAWDGPALERGEVPYGSASLPYVRIHAQADATQVGTAQVGTAQVGTAQPRQKDPLVLFGGFDSYLEELVRWSRNFGALDRDLVMFDGPGQGTALVHGLTMTFGWERPVGTVLDQLDIERCAAMGMSLGGLLVMRAAAFEPRIDRVVAMDVFYRMLDGLTIRLPRPAGWLIERIIARRDSATIDRLVERMTTRDQDIAWKVRQAEALTGTSTPHDLCYELIRWTFAGLGPLVHQDVLLLASTDDQYVPFSRLAQERSELVNAASVTTRVFTAEEHAAEHCQLGNMPLAFGVVRDWLDATEG